MVDDGQRSGRERPANDNLPPDGRDVKDSADATGQLDAVVLSIARLMGRRMAREDFEALQAVNDNTPRNTGVTEDEADKE